MKLAIIGSRSFNDYGLLERNMHKFPSLSEIVSGGARGADSLAAKYAHEYGYNLTEFIPDWERNGKRAGFLRNETIICYSDEVLAFWDGVSKGTAHSLSIAKKLKKPTTIIYF